MLPHWFRSFPGYNPALLPPELTMWNSSAMNLPALGNVAHAQGYDLPPVGTPMHLSHSGPFRDPTRSQSFPIHLPPQSNPQSSIPLVNPNSASSPPSDNHQQYLEQIRDELRTSLTDHITKELQQSFQENFPKQPPSQPPASLPVPTPPITSPNDATAPLPIANSRLPVQPPSSDPPPPDQSATTTTE